MTKIDFKIPECFVTWRSIGPNVTAFLVFSPLLQQPIGTAYVSFAGKAQGGKERADILDCWVTPSARRQGVMSLILDALFSDWKVDVVLTQEGSRSGGEAWLLAKGFRVEPNTGLWFLDKSSTATANSLERT